MIVIITGTSKGIGKAVAQYFIRRGHEVYGLDKTQEPIEFLFSLEENKHYHHYMVDCSNKDNLPDLPKCDILINNAGEQNGPDDIKNNLYSTIYVTEKYGIQDKIKSILFNASVSAHTGFEFPEYVASKAGMLGYMKNVACRVSKYKATCNSISCGGVMTDLNLPVMENKDLWKKIMKVTPLKRWATTEEIAEWIYFITVTNKFMTGQDIVIDGGEKDLNNTFVWTDNCDH